MTDPWVQNQINSEGSYSRNRDGETVHATPRSGRNNSPAIAGDIAAGSHEPALPTTPPEGHDKAVDWGAADRHAKHYLEQENIAFQISNLARAYKAAVAEVERLTKINEGLCNDHNTLLIDGARLEDRAKRAEAALQAAVAEVERLTAVMELAGKGITELEQRAERAEAALAEAVAKEREALIKSLADRYMKDTSESAAVADLCDETLDRSGALLGELRDYVRNLPEDQRPRWLGGKRP